MPVGSVAVKERHQPLVLVDTAGLSEEEWLAYRRKGIGGSDVAALLGISPWRTARDLFYDKLNIAVVEDHEDQLGGPGDGTPVGTAGGEDLPAPDRLQGAIRSKDVPAPEVSLECWRMWTTCRTAGRHHRYSGDQDHNYNAKTTGGWM